MDLYNHDQKNKAREGKKSDNEAVTEEISKKIDKDSEVLNHSLCNSYLLNEIKAQDDAIRQVMSICTLLMSAYSAIIINIIKEIPADSVNNKILIILSLPLLIWILGFFISVMNLNPTSKNWPPNVLYETTNQKAIDFLFETEKRKYRAYKLSSTFMILGLAVAFIIAILTVSKY